MEPMTNRVEVWPVAAEPVGLWLLSGGDALRSTVPVPADSSLHAEAELTLFPLVSRDQVLALHSTSWREDSGCGLFTFMAVVKVVELDVRAAWPQAKPISPRLLSTVGRPFRHGPAEPPTPRYVDVLLHGLRHLKYLSLSDDDMKPAFDEHWHRHLAALEPDLAKMFRHDEQQAA